MNLWTNIIGPEFGRIIRTHSPLKIRLGEKWYGRMQAGNPLSSNRRI